MNRCKASPGSRIATSLGLVVLAALVLPVAASAYTISGTVSLGSSNLSSVTVTFAGFTTGNGTVTTSGSSGDNYTHSVTGSGTVTPSRSGYVFSPASLSISAATGSADFAATATYTVSGTVTLSYSNLSGVTVTFAGFTTGNGTVTTSGSYGDNFTHSGLTGSGTVTPSLAGYTFSPTSRSISAATGSADFTASRTISGTITSGGVGLAGVTVAVAGYTSATTAANGTYSITGVSSSSHTVTPTLSGYTFSPATRSVTGGGVCDFTATYTITGTVTSGGSGLAGVTITLSGGGAGSTTTAANGTYSVAGAGGTTIVTPTLAGYAFSPTGTSVGFGARTGVNFTATYTITGTVTLSGNGLSGVAITLSGGGSGSTTTAANGTYSVSGAGGTTIVTPTLAGYTFSPTGTSVGFGARTGVNFTAAPSTYTGSCSVTSGGAGLAGVTVTYSGFTTGDGTATTDGSGACSKTVSGSGTVTPTLDGYEFSPTSGSLSLADQTADFTATYAISGTVTCGGVAVTGVTIDVTGAGDGNASTSTDGAGYYEISGLSVAHTVTPSLDGCVFTPASTDVTGAATCDFSFTYMVSGTVTSGGTALAGVAVDVTGTDVGDISTVTAADGTYSVSGLTGSVTVTPTLAGYEFSATSVSLGFESQTADFDGTYAISGTVTSGGVGLSGVAIDVTGTGDGNTSTITDGSGAYTVSGLSGDHTVTPSLTGYAFSPTSSDVSAPATRDFDCNYAISGTITSGGAPLAGVTVDLSGAGSDSTTTAADGTYSFSGLAGAYTVTPTLEGYDFSPFSTDVVGPDTVDFDSTYTVSGTITNDGVGLPGVLVTLKATGDGDPYVDGSATTAADGSYSVSGLSGAQNVYPSLTGYAFLPKSTNVTGPSTCDFTATYKISGTVMSGGTGLMGVTITVTDSGGGISSTTTTNSQGTYSTRGLSGAQTVTPTLTGYVFSPTSRDVTGTTDTCDFTATYTVSGTVTCGGVGLAGVAMTVTGAGVGDGSATTASDGTYSISGLSGANTVTPTLAGYVFSPASRSVSAANVTTNFTATYTISGTVTSGGVGLKNVSVAVTGTGGGNHTTTTSSSGTYSVSGLSGPHTVTPTLAGYSFLPASTDVTGPTTTCDFAAAYTVSGTVTCGGAGLAGVAITVTGAGDGNGSTTTAADGTYSIGGLLGAHTVTPTLAGYVFSPVSRDVSSTSTTTNFKATYTISGTVTSGGVGLKGVTMTVTGTGAGNGSATTNSKGAYSLSWLSGPHTVTPTLAGYVFSPTSIDVTGATTTCDFTATYTVSGTVKTGDIGVAGVTVTVTGAGVGAGSALTAADGTYSISGLSGANTLTPTLAGYVFSPSRRGVTAASTAIDFSATYTITGTVTLDGIGLKGVTITVTGTGAGNRTATTSHVGFYSISGLSGAHTVTPTLAGYDFLPISTDITGASTCDFTATSASPGAVVGSMYLVYTGDTETTSGTAVTLKAKLTFGAAPDAPAIPGVTVTFLVDGYACSGVTDETGEAMATVPANVLPSGTYAVGCSTPAVAGYPAAGAVGRLVVDSTGSGD